MANVQVSPPMADHIHVYCDSVGRAQDVVVEDRHGTAICKLPLTSVTQTLNAGAPGEVHLGLYSFRVTIHNG